MGRLLAVIATTYAVCALVSRSFDPLAWNGGAQALALIVVGAALLMHVEHLFTRSSRTWRRQAQAVIPLRPFA